MAVALALLPISSAYAAGFIEGRADWMALTPDQRQTYVRGALDAQLVHFNTDTKADTQRKLALPKCLVDLKVTSRDLADLVTRGYAEDLSSWGLAPPVILIQQLFKLCPY